MEVSALIVVLEEHLRVEEIQSGHLLMILEMHVTHPFVADNQPAPWSTSRGYICWILIGELTMEMLLVFMIGNLAKAYLEGGILLLNSCRVSRIMHSFNSALLSLTFQLYLSTDVCSRPCPSKDSSWRCIVSISLS